MFDKQFKDPIYGYIEIDSKLVSEVIDTPAFQRLKDIRQTSYTPLYPAAYHNRYIHSLGVYHLGRIAFGAIKSQFEDEDKSIAINGQLSKIQNIFICFILQMVSSMQKKSGKLSIKSPKL